MFYGHSSVDTDQQFYILMTDQAYKLISMKQNSEKISLYISSMNIVLCS